MNYVLKRILSFTSSLTRINVGLQRLVTYEGVHSYMTQTPSIPDMGADIYGDRKGHTLRFTAQFLSTRLNPEVLTQT